MRHLIKAKEIKVLSDQIVWEFVWYDDTTGIFEREKRVERR